MATTEKFLSRQTSILTPAQTLPETLLFVLSWMERSVLSATELTANVNVYRFVCGAS